MLREFVKKIYERYCRMADLNMSLWSPKFLHMGCGAILVVRASGLCNQSSSAFICFTLLPTGA